MKKICLIRHAKSDWANENLDDFDRPLNARGFQDAKNMSEKLRDSGLKPDGICSSTAVRAGSTALIFARRFELGEKAIRFYPELYEAGEKEFMEVLKKLPAEWDNVLVFAHNETITRMANKLGGQRISSIPTCGMVLMETKITKWSDLTGCRFLAYDFPKNQGGED